MPQPPDQEDISSENTSSLSFSLLQEIYDTCHLSRQEIASIMQGENNSSHHALGIGCDIIEIERFKNAVMRTNGALLNRILTQTELESLSELKDPYPSLAARFAAKEALSKALGCGIGQYLSWTDIEILKEKSGKPTVYWSQHALDTFPIGNTYLSMSHSKELALAFAIITSI